MTSVTERRGTRVLQVGPLKPSLEQVLAERYDALHLPGREAAADFADAHGHEVGVVVTSGRTGVTSALMDALPALGAVVNFGVGYDKTDVASAQQRGIQVANTPDVLTDCVADTAVGLALTAVRRLAAADRFVREGGWASATQQYPLTHRLSGMRVGILGLGRIGQAVATRLEGFGCPIAYHSRREVAGSGYDYAASPRDLAHDVQLLVVATSGTTLLVDDDVLDALGPDGYLVNVARGSVVDEAALTARLHDGRLAGAGLDVFADEPHVPPALTDLDQVVLTPHLASATVETRAAMEQLCLDNVASWLERGSVLTPVPAVGA